MALYRSLLATLVLVTIFAPIVSFCQETSKPVPLPSPRTQEEARWIKMLPSLVDAHNERASATNAHVDRCVASIKSLKTNQGIDAFIAEAMSLKSKAMCVTDPAGHRKWMKRLFREHVVPVNRLQDVVRIQSKSLESALADVDNDLLIAVQADIDLDPTSLRCKTVDVARINRQTDLVIDDVCKSVQTAVGKSLASFAIATTGGLVSENILRNSLKDDRGNVSFFNQMLALGGGLLADHVVSEIATEVLQPKKTLKADINALADRVINRCVNGSGAVRTSWNQLCTAHHNQILNAVTASYAVDRRWASAVLHSLKLDQYWTLEKK